MADQTVTALAPDGTPIELPASEVPALERGREGRVLSDAEATSARHRVALDQELNGFEGYFAPPIAGAARGLTFGLSDLMLSEIPGVRKRLADYEEYAPGASTGGEIAGMLGGALLGGGAPGVAGKLGGLAEGAIVEGLGAESALARSAGRVLGKAAAGSIENGLYEVGKTASDTVIHNEPLTAEKLVAGAKHGVLLGGGVGAVLGGLGSLYRETRPAARRLADLGVSESAAIDGAPRVPAIDADAGLDGGYRGYGGKTVGDGATYADSNGAIRYRDSGGLVTEEGPSAIKQTGETEYQMRTQRVPLDDINVPNVWDETKLPDLRAKRAAGVELDPIRIGRMSESEPWEITDGIHRSNVAREAGDKDILAKFEVEGKPYRLNDSASDFTSPVETSAGPIDIGALRRPPAPEPIRPLIEAQSPRGTIGDYIAKTADVKTIKALGGSAGDLRSLESSVKGGFRRVAQDVRSDVEATTGKSFGLHSRSSLNEYATKRFDELGEKLGGMLEKLDEGGSGIAPKPARLVDQVRNDIIKPNLIQKADGSFVTLPGQEKVVNAVEGWLGRIEEAFADRAPTFKEWQRIRVGLDKEINYAAAKVSPKTAALKQLRGAIEDELVSSGEQAASTMGSSFQADYQATKSLYQSVKKAAELTERGVSRDLANNSFGLTSRMAGIAGASVGGMAGGLAAGLVGKVVQSHGDQLAADLLSRAASMSGVQRLVGQVGRELDSGVSKLILGKAPSATSGIPIADAARESKVSAPRKDFARISNTIASAAANPAGTAERVSRSLGALAEHAPGTADDVVMTTLRGVDFLSTKLPPTRQDPYSLQPQLQTGSRASDAEISRFMRYATAVDDPLIVLREAKTGTLTRDHVEAVKAVYPKLYDEMRGAVMNALVESKSELPYTKRIQLGILLDLPADKTLSPEFMRAVQATYSVDQAGAEPPHQTAAAPDIAGAYQTGTQSAMSGTQ